MDARLFGALALALTFGCKQAASPSGSATKSAATDKSSGKRKSGAIKSARDASNVDEGEDETKNAESAEKKPGPAKDDKGGGETEGGEAESGETEGGETEGSPSEGQGSGATEGSPAKPAAPSCAGSSEVDKGEGGCRLKASGAVFSRVAKDGDEAKQFTGEEAASYCKNLSESGFDDWVLPSAYDLLVVLEKKAKDALGMTEAGKLVSATQTRWFGPAVFDTEYDDIGSGNDKNGVICVRKTLNAQAPDEEEGCMWQKDTPYRPKNGGCMDPKSGLIFSEAYKFGKEDLTVTAADKYCKDLKENNRDDWRLPSAAELQAAFKNRASGALRGDSILWYLTTTPGTEKAGRNMAVLLPNDSDREVKTDSLCDAEKGEFNVYCPVICVRTE